MVSPTTIKLILFVFSIGVMSFFLTEENKHLKRNKLAKAVKRKLTSDSSSEAESVAEEEVRAEASAEVEAEQDSRGAAEDEVSSDRERAREDRGGSRRVAEEGVRTRRRRGAGRYYGTAAGLRPRRGGVRGAGRYSRRVEREVGPNKAKTEERRAALSSKFPSSSQRKFTIAGKVADVKAKSLVTADSRFIVGAFAQVDGSLTPLDAVEVEGADFELDFWADPNRFEKMTKLVKRFPKQFAGVDLPSLPGVMIFIVEGDSSDLDNYYFGAYNPKALSGGSALVRSSQVLGDPLMLTHPEIKVIVPVPTQLALPEKIESGEDKIRNWAAKEKEAVANQFIFLEKLKRDIYIKNLTQTHNHLLRVGTAESKLYALGRKIDLELLEMVKNLSDKSKADEYQKMHESLKGTLGMVLNFTSRSDGSLRKSLSRLAAKVKILKRADALKMSNKNRRRYHDEIKESWNTLDAATAEVVNWNRELVAGLDKVEKMFTQS